MDELVKDIYEELKTELDISEEADLSILLIKVRNAYREVRRMRNYPDSYEDARVEKDMKKYFHNIRRLALYDYNQYGVEGEISHNDNTGTRTWDSREKCLEGVVAICTLV